MSAAPRSVALTDPLMSSSELVAFRRAKREEYLGYDIPLTWSDDPEAMAAGDVLVYECTDPSWRSLMALAAALVVDIGGPTSHRAIVAREFGLPCVMGSGTGTRAIADGDRVRVDGAAGTVTILERTNGTSMSREGH